MEPRGATAFPSSLGDGLAFAGIPVALRHRLISNAPPAYFAAHPTAPSVTPAMHRRPNFPGRRLQNSPQRY